MTDELINWLRAQLDDDERWALAANRPYEYATDGATAPPTGVHWRWVAGEQWETVTPDPAVNEFVTEPGWPCYLATVEEWPSRTDGRMMPRSYANEVVEMDAAAGGHIIRWDPARVLAEVDAKRRILDAYAAAADEQESEYDGGFTAALLMALCILALPYADRPGYRDEWRP